MVQNISNLIIAVDFIFDAFKQKKPYKQNENSVQIYYVRKTKQNAIFELMRYEKPFLHVFS